MREPVADFDRVLLIGAVDAAAIVAQASRVELVGPAASRSRLDVEGTIRWARGGLKTGERVLIVTDRDLFLPECHSLLGFADWSAGIAIVSTFYLRQNCDRDQLAARLRNEIAHELGHLKGLRHCSQPFCVMRPIVEPAELDARSSEPCGRCPRTLRQRLLRRFGSR